MPVATEAFPQRETMSKEEIQSIQSFTLPIFEPPYPASINKNAAKAKANAHAWVRKDPLDKMFNSPELLQIYIDSEIDGLPTQVYVDADVEEASWACKYFLWTFALDDHLDDDTNFYSPEQSASLLLELNVVLMWSFPDDPELRNNLLAILDKGDAAERKAALEYLDAKLAVARLHPGTVYDFTSPDIAPLVKGFGELWAIMTRLTRPEYMLRWGLSFQRYVLSNIQEVRNRNHKVIPSLEDYITLRRSTAGVELCLIMAEFLGKANLPKEQFDSPELQRLILAGNDVVSWMNDMWSFRKEALHGEVHNLVYILSLERGCSYEEAGKIAHQMFLDRVNDVGKSAQILERITPPENKHGVAQYIKAAQNWCSGGYVWHSTSVRYTPKE